MADTRVTTTGDRRVTTTGDVRITDAGLVTLITFDQRVQETIAAADLITFDQVVGEVIPADDLVALRQVVRKDPVVIAAADVVTFDQTVRVYSTIAAANLVAFDQTVRQVIAVQSVITFQQTVLTAQQQAESPTRIILGGVDITDTCSPALSIVASEGDNRTASVTIIDVPLGTLDITSYQGKAISISRLQAGSLVPLFTGFVDVPRYHRYPARIVLTCSDLRNERVGNEDQYNLKSMTGGLFSPITQRDDATGTQWVTELMRTVSGSLDYTSSGVLRYRPWAIGSPRYTLTDPDVHYREAESEFATRSEIVNRVTAELGYRYFNRNAISYAVSLSVELSGNCTLLEGCLPKLNVEDENGQLVPQILPSKSSILSAAQSVSGWQLESLVFDELPADGWYRNSDDATRKVRWFAEPVIKETRAMGADIELERYISQPKRETYSLVIEAPESIDQYGAVNGDDLRYAVETRVDGAIYEERGCSVITDPDDRRADVNAAFQAVQAMASKQILASHRQNYVALRYKPENGSANEADFLPIEIGDVVSVAATEITATGFVTEFEHRQTREGDRWTDIKLAVSRVDSDVTVTESWTIPAAPTSFTLLPQTSGQISTPDCPAPAGAVSVEGVSRLEPDGTVIIIAPAVGRADVDEIQGVREVTYDLEIPNNSLSIEVV